MIIHRPLFATARWILAEASPAKLPFLAACLPVHLKSASHHFLTGLQRRHAWVSFRVPPNNQALQTLFFRFAPSSLSLTNLPAKNVSAFRRLETLFHSGTRGSEQLLALFLSPF